MVGWAERKVVYDSNRKRTVMVTCAGTGWPLRVAGWYRYCFTDSTAAPRKDGGPESTLRKWTSPSVSTTASITTFPVSKSRKSSRDATARTDLSNFGGTMLVSSGEATTGTELAGATGRTATRFAASVAEGDVGLTAGGVTEPLDAKG